MNEGGVHSLGSAFNSFFDGVNAALWRMLELPLFVLLLGLMLVGFLAFSALRAFYARRRPGVKPGAPIRWLFFALCVLAAAVTVDHKIVATLNEVRSGYSQQLLGDSDAVPSAAKEPSRETTPGLVRHPGEPDAPFYDADEAGRVLGAAFGDFAAVAEALHPGIDYVVIRTNDRNRPDLVTHAFLAIVDLTHDDLAIEITPSLGEKSLTSAFARGNGAIVAINGEAGQSPAPDSGFGQWTGPWIARGKVVAFEGASKRPFIGFDRSARARYYAESEAGSRPVPDTYDAIWGRWDILRDGVNLGLKPTSSKPRTVMGVDRSGDRLYLLVVAGGKPRYSLGSSLEDAAAIVQAFGAWNAMACDEGGSSVMYLRKFGRVVSNLPGMSERAVYSHFGVSAR